MSTRRIKYQNINKNRGEESLLFDVRDVGTEGIGVDGLEEVLQQDPNIFLLNNLLMSVQFFENYERDVRLLREHWFKEVPLDSHHKKCFYADCLSRLVGTNVRYSPRHGPRKHSEAPLHPLRIYISSDNLEAAYDPSALRHDKRNIAPLYQFTVKTNEKNEKSGCVHLVEYKRSEASSKSHNGLPSFEKAKQQPNFLRRAYNGDVKNTRRLTRTEKFIGAQIRDVAERRNSSFVDAADGVIPPDAFYRFAQPEARLKPTPMEEFRMNSAMLSSHEIPLLCFQRQDVKLTQHTQRRTGLTPLFRSQTVLNSAAFKGYFCDLLQERLSGALGLNDFAVSMGSVLEEFVVVAQAGGQCSIAPVISIRDWKNFIAINKRPKGGERKTELPWPSSYMHKVINILPCNVVPVGHSPVQEDNPDYEKEWKIVFPKAEEFLLLHMMHAHVRCFFFALLIYKSFIEAEVNVASLGPTHLRHLLFWRVQKNFLAWPEDRPAETLMAYLKTLYRKLQNKSLPDFFITSRNLFATSLPKDLHKAQSLVKKILENPVPFVIRAIRNLQLKAEFYPVLDTFKLYDVLTAAETPEKPKQVKKEKKGKHVHFENDEEQRWKRNAIKQIQLERKADEENAPKLSVESIKADEAFDFKVLSEEKCLRVLEIFLSHFLNMRKKSLEFGFSSQAALYLSLAQRLFDSMAAIGGGQREMKALKEKLNELREKSFPVGGKTKPEREEERTVKADVYTPESTSQDEVTAKGGEVSEEFKIEVVLKEKTQEEDKEKLEEDFSDDDGMYETKL